MNFRNLTEEDIEVRIQSVKPSGIILLLYKNARVDMNVLDETVGAQNWQRRHYECKGNLFCEVGINIDFANKNSPPTWVWKSDCGTESNAEAQKGEASDSFKRACFNWGIGRELYTSPFIWIDKKYCGIIEQERNGRKTFLCNDSFEIEKIKIENKKILGLAIKNATTGKRCFLWQH